MRDPRLQLPSTGPCRCRRPPPCLLLSSPLSLFLLSRLRAARAYMSRPWLPPEHELRPGWVTYPLKILSRSTQIARLVQTSLSTARLHQVVYTRFVVDTQVATHRLVCRLVSTSPSTRNQCDILLRDTLGERPPFSCFFYKCFHCPFKLLSCSMTIDDPFVFSTTLVTFSFFFISRTFFVTEGMQLNCLTITQRYYE